MPVLTQEPGINDSQRSKVRLFRAEEKKPTYLFSCLATSGPAGCYPQITHPMQSHGLQGGFTHCVSAEKKNAYLQNICMTQKYAFKGGIIRSSAVKPDEWGVRVWEETQQSRHTWTTVCFHTSTHFPNFRISKQREREREKKSEVQKVMGPPVLVMTTTPIQVFLPPFGTTLLLIPARKHVGGAAEHGGFSGGLKLTIM